jgi:hypothetical protein
VEVQVTRMQKKCGHGNLLEKPDKITCNTRWFKYDRDYLSRSYLNHLVPKRQWEENIQMKVNGAQTGVD